MLTYIYFVKCPGCEDEHFDFFNDAKEYAIGLLSKKPIITQIEVDRNDFGECTDSCDLGTVWSWEDMMETEDTPAKSIFTKDDLKRMANGQDPEFDNIDNSLGFDSVEDAVDFLVKDEEEAIAGYEKVEGAIEDFEVENKKEILDTIDHIKAEEEEHIEELKAVCERKPIPEGMTIEQLVEEMEENEDEVECTWCNELFGKDQCRKEVDLGWLCDRCQAAIKSRGEPLTFRENNYWDFLDESFSSKDKVELEYNSLRVTLQGPKRAEDDWDEVEETVQYTYAVDAPSVIEVLWEDCLTEEDVASVPGGLDALYEDDKAFNDFMKANFDDLVEKYMDKLLKHFEADATEEYERTHSLGESINESIDPRDLVELEYPSLTVTLYGNKRDVDDWDEVEHTTSHVFLVPKVEVATAIWENWITEEDVKDVEGGLEALDDDIAWEKFLEAHFDDLFEKYEKQILEYFKEEAAEDFRERSQEEYDMERWTANQKKSYADLEDVFNESKQKPFLEEFDDAETRKANLIDCPECGTASYDMKEQYCSNCGLGL